MILTDHVISQYVKCHPLSQILFHEMKENYCEKQKGEDKGKIKDEVCKVTLNITLHLTCVYGEL